MHLRSALIAVFTLTFAGSTPAQNGAELREIAAKADAAVVSVMGENINGRTFAPGRGFLLGQNVVATDYGVIREASKVYVKTSDGRRKEARILGVDSRLAVAVLSVSDLKAAPLALCGSDALAVGNTVYIAEASGSVRREVIREEVSIAGRRYLKMAGQVSQEARGSPVLNGSGEVIAVTVADPTRSGASAFAVPSTYLVRLGYISIEGFRAGSGRYPPRAPEIEEIKSETGPRPKFIRKAAGTLQRDAVRKVIPLYPPLAKAARVVGIVVVEMTINEDGDVVAVRALSGNQYLRDAALAAARGWKFPPSKSQGQPVRIIGTITFNFAS